MITQEQVEATLDELQKNPPIPVDLARVTCVFSTKLQFVEFEIKRARLSQTQLIVPIDLLNADARGELKRLIKSKPLAFSEFKEVPVPVPAYFNGEAVKDAKGKQHLDQASGLPYKKQERL